MFIPSNYLMNKCFHMSDPIHKIYYKLYFYTSKYNKTKKYSKHGHFTKKHMLLFQTVPKNDESCLGLHFPQLCVSPKKHLIRTLSYQESSLYLIARNRDNITPSSSQSKNRTSKVTVKHSEKDQIIIVYI